MRGKKETAAPDEGARRGIGTAAAIGLAALPAVLLVFALLCGKGCGRADPGKTEDRISRDGSFLTADPETSSEGQPVPEESTRKTEEASEGTDAKNTGERSGGGPEETERGGSTEDDPSGEDRLETVLSGESLIGETTEGESREGESREGHTPAAPGPAPASSAAAATRPAASAPVSVPASSAPVPAASAPVSVPASSASVPAPAAPAASSSAASSLPAASPAETPPHRHHYEKRITRAATCGAEGAAAYVCACGASYTETIPATGQHEWKAVTTTIHHDAATHTVHHDEVRRWITDVPAFDEYVYELHAVCNGCGKDLTVLQQESGVTPAEHSWQHYENDGVGCGWHDEQVVVGTVHHDEIGHEEVTPARDETVVDAPAWDETVVTGCRCVICGAVSDETAAQEQE